MEINRDMLNALLSSDDETLRGKLLEIAKVVGIDEGEAYKLTSDMKKIRLILSVVSDDDISKFLGSFRKEK